MENLSVWIAIFCAFWQTILSAQLQFNEPIKQVTNFSFDSRNPQFFISPGNRVTAKEIYFQARHDSVSDIYLMKYDPVSDSFYQAYPLVADGWQNINPTGKEYGNQSNPNRIIVWQSNKNGQWDISGCILANGVWGQPSVLVPNAGFESKPRLLLTFYRDQLYTYDFLYECNHSIMRYYDPGSGARIDTIFRADSSKQFTHYSQPAGIVYGYGLSTIYVAAVKTTASGSSVLVYRTKRSDSADWDPEMPVYSAGNCSNPVFVSDLVGYRLLSFETVKDNKHNIYFISTSDFGNDAAAEKLQTDSSYETMNFCQTGIFIVSKKKLSDMLYYNPCTYLLHRNDSVFVHIGMKYTLAPNWKEIAVPTRIKDPAASNGVPVEYYKIDEGLLSYTLWEDSANGKINIFGCRRYDPLGAVRDNSRPAEFNIDNCYPNPFNPATKISFSIFSSAKIAGGNNSEYFVSERVTVKIFPDFCQNLEQQKKVRK